MRFWLLILLGLTACGPRDDLDGDEDAGSTDAGFMCTPSVNILVRSVSDGDTLVVSAGATVKAPDGRPMDGTRIRLLGIDTPEISHNGAPADCYGNEAWMYTEAEIGGRTVTVEYDPTNCSPPNRVAGCRDDYDRVLAYVKLSGKVHNEELIKGGYARVFGGVSFRHRDSDKYKTLETAAKNSRVGLWNECR